MISTNTKSHDAKTIARWRLGINPDSMLRRDVYKALADAGYSWDDRVQAWQSPEQTDPRAVKVAIIADPAIATTVATLVAGALVQAGITQTSRTGNGSTIFLECRI